MQMPAGLVAVKLLKNRVSLLKRQRADIPWDFDAISRIKP